MAELTSRERMLRALNRQEADHVPCCFMSFTALRKRHHENLYELAKAERAMGLDSLLFIPVAPRPVRPEHPEHLARMQQYLLITLPRSTVSLLRRPAPP